MAVSSLKQMLDRLLETGLISDQQFRELAERKNPDDTLPSIAGVTRRLVDEKVLTPFQADRISDGKPEELVIDEYVLVDVLGSGGMGEVCLARHRFMHREVAIKLLVPGSAAKIESIERFKREAQVAAKLDHSNVVRALDAGVYNNQYYLVMEYVRGKSLGEIVKGQGAVRLDRALDFTIQAGQGIEYAHRQSVIHRDIKPSNLLLSEDGTVKVTDLGLSRVLQPAENVTEIPDDGDDLTSSGMIMGTVDFMAPEQAATPRGADERADIYGLGCTLYFLATGGAVFPGDTPMARLIAHRETPPPKITDALPNAPRSLDRVLKRMLAKSPDSRYQTVSDALRDLRGCLREYQEGLSDLPDTEFRRDELPAATRRSRPSIVIASCVIATVLVGVGLLMNPDWMPTVAARRNVQPGASPGSDPRLPEADAAENDPNAPVMPENVQIEDGSEPVDVLRILDLKTAHQEGVNWILKDGQLVTGVDVGESKRRALLALPVDVGANYWLTMDVRRLPVDTVVKGPFVVGLSVGPSSCVAAFDAHREAGTRISFLDSVRGADFQTTFARTDFLRIREDEWVTVRIQVGVDESGLATVSAGIDDILPMEWQGRPDEIEIASGWAPRWPAQLFVGSNLRTQYEVRNLWVGPGTLPDEESEESPAEVPTDSANPADAESGSGQP